MKNRKPPYLIIAIAAYTLLLATLTLVTRLGPERWWFSAINLYLPQVFWLAPGLILLAACLIRARRWLWAPLLCCIWVAGPLMGFQWSKHNTADTGEHLRIMTLNVKYGLHGALARMALKYEIDETRPDVILFQDAGGMMEDHNNDFLRTWYGYIHNEGQYVIVSRLPLLSTETRSLALPWDHLSCQRYQVKSRQSIITIYNVHLESPRHGLNAIREAGNRFRYLPNAIRMLEGNVHTRLLQSYILRIFLMKEQGPVIIAGDLNSPDDTMVCAGLREAGLHDAFAEGGRGYGYTYGHFLLKNRLPWLRESWMRIDHIMMSPHFATQRAWSGTGDASDHRPVIADLILKHP